MDLDHQSGNPANTVAIYAALVYDIVAATNSSPQTAEINAEARAGTLMKWVKIGELQAIAFTLLGSALDERRWPPIVGGSIAMVLLWAQYKYAIKSGLASGGPPTERY